MSRNRVDVSASADDVFGVLLDPWAYPRWVVGAKRIRHVDPEWPAPGARFHHTVGAGPASLDDSSKLLEVDPPNHIALEVRFRPVGVARVRLDVEDHGGRSTITMSEQPAAGPVDWVWSPALNALAHGRNAWSLRRLARLVEGRHRVVAPHEHQR